MRNAVNGLIKYNAFKVVKHKEIPAGSNMLTGGFVLVLKIVMVPDQTQ